MALEDGIADITVKPVEKPENTSAAKEKIKKDYMIENREDLLKLSKDQRLDENQKESLKNVMLGILAITNLEVKEYIEQNSKDINKFADMLKGKRSVELGRKNLKNKSFLKNGKDENGITKKEYEQAIINMENFITRYASGSTNNTTSEGKEEGPEDKKTDKSNEKKTNSENLEKPSKTEIQKFDDFLKESNINETFKSMLEKTRDSFKSMITENISKELLKSKRLTEKRKDGAIVLNKLGNETYAAIERKITPNRMSNLTYSILNKLVEEVNKKIGKSNGNAEKEIQEKALLFMTMKNIITPKQKTSTNEKIERKGISTQAAERIRAMVQPSTDLATIEKNLGIFIKAKLKEGRFDIEKGARSIIKGAKENNTSIKEAIPTVLGGAFDNAFSYLNNTQGAEALLTGLLGEPNDKNKEFDASKITKDGLKLETETPPTPDQLSNLAGKINALIGSLPNEKTNPEGAKNLKEKLANGKIDTMLKQLDNLGPLKGIALMVINWLNNSTRGKSILEFFGKSYGLDKKQIEKLLERPLVKSGVDTYSGAIEDARKGKEKDNYVGLNFDKVEEIKTDYFRLHNGVVCKKQGHDYMIKQVDKNGNLVDYPQNPENVTKPTKIKLGAKEIDIDATGKVTKIDNNDLLATDNFLKYFIESDLHSDSFKTAVTTMLVTKEPKSKDGVPTTNFGNLKETQRNDQIETLIGGKKIPDMVQELLKNNKYVFSTEDIVAHVLEKALEEYKKSKEGKVEANKLGIELTGVPYTLKAGTAPTDADYQKWIKIPDGKTATYSIYPTIDRYNKKAGEGIKELIVTVTIDGKANKITIPAVIIEAETTTPAATSAETTTTATTSAETTTTATPSAETTTTAVTNAETTTTADKATADKATADKATADKATTDKAAAAVEKATPKIETDKNTPITFTSPDFGNINSDNKAQKAFDNLANACKSALGAGYESAIIELAATSQSSSGRMLENATKKNITSNQELFIIKGIPAISDNAAKTTANENLYAINGDKAYTTIGLFKAIVDKKTTYFYVTRKNQ